MDREIFAIAKDTVDYMILMEKVEEVESNILKYVFKMVEAPSFSGIMTYIDWLKELRIENNRLWMAMLKLSFLEDPVKSKEIMKKIMANDMKITRLRKEMI